MKDEFKVWNLFCSLEPVVFQRLSMLLWIWGMVEDAEAKGGVVIQ